MRARLAASIAVLAIAGLFSHVRAAEPAMPRLVVLVVFDQMRGDFLERWFELFGDGGFRRLISEGAWFTNCHYPYAMTATGPGHASMLTGCSPATHGIIGNNWYDRQSASAAYCASFPRYERLPPAPKTPRKETDNKDTTDTAKKVPAYGAPVRLLAPTLGDVLREASPNSKIIGLSLKDRSAVLPVGRKPTACYWFDKGEFVTSTYYMDHLHDWAKEFNKNRSVDRWFGAKWERLRPDLDYEKHSSADDSPGEGVGTKQGKTFPHPFGTAKKIGSEYYNALANSPCGNQILLDMVFRAIEAEELGRDDAPDLLTVSFSSNDLIGHTWGPDSQEVLDVTLRSDLIVRDLLNHLDEQVGKGRYLIAMTADHGICPLPERAKMDGKVSGRQTPLGVLTAAEAHLRKKFGEPESSKSRWVEAANEGGIYLNHRLLAARKIDGVDAARALAEWLDDQPYVQKAFARDDLLAKPLSDDPIIRRVQKTLHADRTGDVVFVLKPYHFVSTYKTGTTHGSPHAYDTHVPLVVFGPGVKLGKRGDAVTPQACAAILAQALGVPPPKKADAPVPAQLFVR